jgi:alkanesulfonate monooxygenase SsuD/methylene tetrahydromethanopterin reductase-like flavin-dependent oxidoreductase (luciferase family)
VDLGVVIRPELAPEELIERARRAEAAGFKELWLWEDCFWGGGIAASATALAATETITVGLGIMPAPVRNAAFVAMEAAALARLHPGRFHLGLGHGIGEWMRQIGAKPASQLTLLEELTEAVRALLAGATVSVEGRYVRLRGVKLGHPPHAVPPVSLGVRGPKGLELSGRVADGTVLDSHSSIAYVRWARERIDAGRAAAARDDAHRVTVLGYCATDPAGEAIVQAKLDELRAEGGVRADFLPADAPLSEFALIGDAAARERALTELGRAGADCVVLVPPEAHVEIEPLASAPH